MMPSKPLYLIPSRPNSHCANASQLYSPAWRDDARGLVDYTDSLCARSTWSALSTPCFRHSRTSLHHRWMDVVHHPRLPHVPLRVARDYPVAPRGIFGGGGVQKQPSDLAYRDYASSSWLAGLFSTTSRATSSVFQLQLMRKLAHWPGDRPLGLDLNAKMAGDPRIPCVMQNLQ
ncbi:unnamed protein product [Rhizoctonia solani]|uniref:Uncharacterized protein n=1 Tax=Rhizoctonia solani TaxID=456999 RepID=A0A8H2XCV2_9AGAM|nr:unnamed protein product [Rhizoctonia solani]